MTEAISSTSTPIVETFLIPYECAGQRLDLVLCKLFDFVPSRSFAQKLIESKAVLVSGKQRKASWLLVENDVIEIDINALRPAPQALTPQKIQLDILFEDEHILIVNKPAGLVVHPGAGVPDGTLVNAILAHTGATLPSVGDPLRAGLVHRLDRDTSGIMVIAKSQQALTELSRQFASHTQLRRYRALVFGAPQFKTRIIETWHGRDPKNRLKYAVLQEGEGKLARMKVTVDQVFADGLASALTCELYTGRTHQIRVQLSHHKHGLLGDSLYGPAATADHNSNATPLMRNKNLWAKVHSLAQRQMLHASVLGLTHPASGEPLLFSSEPPVDFKGLEELLAHWK